MSSSVDRLIFFFYKDINFNPHFLNFLLKELWFWLPNCFFSQILEKKKKGHPWHDLNKKVVQIFKAKGNYYLLYLNISLIVYSEITDASLSCVIVRPTCEQCGQ